MLKECEKCEHLLMDLDESTKDGYGCALYSSTTHLALNKDKKCPEIKSVNYKDL